MIIKIDLKRTTGENLVSSTLVSKTFSEIFKVREKAQPAFMYKNRKNGSWHLNGTISRDS